jgi:polysaccharide biosynthesis PFTS motif protein
MIINYLIRQRKRELRNQIRGFRRALRDGYINRIRKLETSLVNLKLRIKPSFEERVVFGSTYLRAEVIIRQFLLQVYSGRQLQQKVFMSYGCNGKSVIYTMPKIWRFELNKHGLSIYIQLSSLSWAFEIVSRYIHGTLIILKLIICGFINAAFLTPKIARKHVYLYDLHRRNIPHASSDILGFDICSWYAGWAGRNLSVEMIAHDVVNAPTNRLGKLDVAYISPPFAHLENFRQISKFIIWAIQSLVIALLSMLYGRWWNALILAEAARAAVVRFSDGERLAEDYLFHFSRSIYRPMWTYEAEAKNSRIICYFYSTYEQPRLSNREENQLYEWGPSTWPLFLVWDEYQASKLKRELGAKTTVKIVGQIYFGDDLETIPELPNKTIAVFDIQPHRITNVYGISTLYDYYYGYPKVHQLFLEDIAEAVRETGLTMTLKSKRFIATNGSKRYISQVRRLESNNNIIIAPSELAAARLIQKCIGAISAPFTSTALYLHEQGYDSVYYDPLGILSKDDPGAHGIRILVSKTELYAWVKKLKHAQ